MTFVPAPTPVDPAAPAWRAWPRRLWRWLAPPDGAVPEAARGSALLLTWLLIAAAVLLGVTYGIAIAAGLVAAPLRDPRSVVVLAAYLGIVLAFALNRAGRYQAAAVLAVATAALSVWAIIWLDFQLPQTLTEILHYTLISVILASLLLSPRATALVAAGHGLASWLAFATIPGLEPDVLVNNLAVLAFISGLLVVAAAVRRRFLAQIERQTRQLADDERRLRAILDHSPDAILLIDPHQPRQDWAIVDCNEAAARLTGYDRAELVAQPLSRLDVTPPGPGERAACLDRLQREKTIHYESVRRHRDGDSIPVEISAALVTLSGRELVLAIERDIADRQRAQAALRRSEERFELVSYATNDAVWDWDLATGQVWWNRGVERLFGYAAGEAGSSVNWWEGRIHPEDRERIVSSLQAALDGGQEFWSREYRFRRADGAYAHVFDRGYVTRDESGRPVRAIGAMMDMTERKRAEDTLRASEARHRALFDASPASLWEEDYSGVKRRLDALRDQGVRDFDEYLRAHPEVVAECGASVRVLDVNQTTLKVYRAASKADLLDNFVQVFRPEPNEGFRRALARLAGGHSDFEWEGVTWTLAGDPLHIHLRWSAVPGYEHSLARVLVSITDITERKRMEEALREAEEKYRTLVEQLPDVVYIAEAGESGRWHYVSPQIQALLGFAPQEWMADSTLWLRRIHPEDRAAVLAHEAEDAAGRIEAGSTTAQEYRMYSREGRLLWVRDNATVVVPGGPGRPSLYHGLLSDITERKRVEEALRVSEARYRALFDASPVSLCEEDFSEVKRRLEALRRQGVKDFDAYLKQNPEIVPECAALVRVTDVNNATLRLYRAERREDLLGSLGGVLGPEGLEDFREVLLHIARGRTEFEWEGLNRTVAGEPLLIHLRWSVAPGHEHTLAKVLLSLTDITERKRMEDALRESEALFRTTFEHSPVGIALLSPEGVYLRASRTLCDMLGYAEAEMLSHRSADFTHPDDVAASQEQMRQLIAGEIKVADLEKRYLHRSGRALWVQRIMTPLRLGDDEPRYLVSMQHDITERRRVEAELTKSNAQLSAWLGDMEQRTREVEKFNELVSLFQTCRDPDEAYDVVAKMAPALFPGDSGALFLIHSSQNQVKTVAHWGGVDYASADLFEPDDCWALRRAQPHLVLDSRQGLVCRHLSPAPPAYMCVPLFAQGELIGGLTLGTPAGLLPERKRQFAKTVADAVGLSLANLRLRESLRQQSIVDILTGLFNRRYMEETLEREVRRCARAKTSLGVMMIDLDHFKGFNDAYGHPAGDALLAALGAYLRKHIRADDIACRYGGEEFTLILPDSTLESTAQRAASLIEGARSLRVRHGLQTLGPVSMSLGVAAFPRHGANGAEVLGAADQALYAAKRQGRDRVVVASP